MYSHDEYWKCNVPNGAGMEVNGPESQWKRGEEDGKGKEKESTEL